MRNKPIKRTRHHKWKRALRGQQMNWEIIVANLAEANADIARILSNAGAPHWRVGALRVDIQHVLHHVLFAWNARHMDGERYERMSPEDFLRCSQMHSDLVPLGARSDKAVPRLRAGKFERGDARRPRARRWTQQER